MEACKCSACVALCEYKPCWGTPEEIEKLLELGYADKLMRDWWVGDEYDTDIICPAIIGYEGIDAPSFPVGKCTLLEDDLCVIHEWKPKEGRNSYGCKDFDGIHASFAPLWDTDKGREIANRWKKEVMEYA